MLAALALASPAPAAETVTVDLGSDEGPPTWRASGFLHGFNDDGKLPLDDLVVPLKIQLHRTRPGSTWSQAERMKALGIRQQVVMSDGWGYTKEHPGDGDNWAKWEAFVAKMVGDAKSRGLKVQWNIWNEPDHKFFWQRTPEQFQEAWKRAYAILRKLDPEAPIVGPSWSGVHPGEKRFDDFLEFCKANQAVPDYVCWHFPRDIVKETRACRDLLKKLDLKPKGLMVNEYCLKHEQVAGRTAWLIAQVERAKLDFSCHAIWGDEPNANLDGIVFDAKKSEPRGQWWAYRRYADIAGVLLRSEPSAAIDLVAGKDQEARCVRVLLGNAGKLTGDVLVRFTDLDKAPWLPKDGKVHATVERIPDDKGAAVLALPTVSDEDLAAKDGVLEVTIPWTSDRDAYAVHLGGK